MSNGQVKIANQRYSSVRNDFCIVFDKNATITEVPDDKSIEVRGYNFASMEEITQASRIKIVDFIGVLVNVGPMTEIQLKNGQMKGKRNIKVADESESTIDVCIWAPAAH